MFVKSSSRNESVRRKRAKSFRRTDSKTTIDRTTSTITVIGHDDVGAERQCWEPETQV